jgi:SAM-dependent methyltransferase
VIHMFRPVVARSPFHGVGQIVRFNWPFYAFATPAVIFTLFAVVRFDVTGRVAIVLYAAAGLGSFWLLASLAAAWIVYDRSTLMTGSWIEHALDFRPRAWINIHAGFDETTPILRTVFKGSIGRVFDIFDPAAMPEPSIARARRSRQRGDREAVDFRRLPAGTGSADAVLVLLAAHELRRHDARMALFNEIHRLLAPHGRAVVGEHLRDWPNFLAFEPGFLHFHARRTWIRCFTRAGFAVRHEFRITPFVRVFILAAGEARGELPARSG